MEDQETRTGRSPSLNNENMTKLKEILKGKDYWTTKEVVVLIKVNFDVDLSEDQVIKILWNKSKSKRLGVELNKNLPNII